MSSWLILPLGVQAQMPQVVKWSNSICKISDDEFRLDMTATLDPGYHIYSVVPSEGDGPLPTVFTFDTSGIMTPIGAPVEPKPIRKFDEDFDQYVMYHEQRVTFSQKVRVDRSQLDGGREANKDTIPIGLSVEYMVCNDMGCMPGGPDQLLFQLSEIHQCSAAKGAEMSYWNIFILGLLGGLLALVTPCVFPMIPLTVSYFTKRGKTKAAGIKDAMLYGLSIVLIYVGLGWVITKIWGSDALYSIASSPGVNIVFFLMFLIFALSFLGAFEIRLPSKLINKADAASDKKGVVGIFFMALTLTLVSFTCTGMLIGSLLAQAALEGGAGPLYGMAGFAIGLAFPFVLFAIFPAWMNGLPKSGGWLNNVKVTLGFLELAFAIKFLSNADLVLQWHLVTREVFLAIWIAVSFILALYLLGVFKMAHDSPEQKVGTFRATLAVIFLSFAFYLLPGMWGAPLKLISGFPPPAFYSESPGGAFGGGAETGSNATEHCPHGLNCIHDYDEALALAKARNKPLFLDFTGWSCANCRRIEANVWSDPEVLRLLKEDVVLASLYCDDRTRLEGDSLYTTLGQKWRAMELEKYGGVAQPFYVVLDHEENIISDGPIGYQLASDVAFYRGWLKAAVDAYIPVKEPVEAEPTSSEIPNEPAATPAEDPFSLAPTQGDPFGAAPMPEIQVDQAPAEIGPSNSTPPPMWGDAGSLGN